MTNTVNSQLAILQSLITPADSKKKNYVTIVKVGEFGFVQNIVCEIKKAVIRDYAQYKNIIGFTYLPKGKRKESMIYLTDIVRLNIYAGIQNANTESVKTSSYNSETGITVTHYGRAFDPAHFEGAIKSINATPIFVKENTYGK